MPVALCWLTRTRCLLAGCGRSVMWKLAGGNAAPVSCRTLAPHSPTQGVQARRHDAAACQHRPLCVWRSLLHVVLPLLPPAVRVGQRQLIWCWCALALLPAVTPAAGTCCTAAAPPLLRRCLRYVAVCCLRLAAAVMTQPGRCLSWCMHPGPCGEDAGRPHSSRLVVRVDAPGRHRFELLEAAALRRAPLPALKAAALYFSSARLAALTLAANQPVPDYHPPGLAPALLCELQVDGSEAHAAAMPLRGSCTLAHDCCVPSLRAGSWRR